MDANLLSSIRGFSKSSLTDPASSPPSSSPSTPAVIVKSVKTTPPVISSSKSDDKWASCQDQVLKEQLLGFVDQLKSGKPPKAIGMVMKGLLPAASKWRAMVFQEAGVQDPEAAGKELVLERVIEIKGVSSPVSPYSPMSPMSSDDESAGKRKKGKDKTKKIKKTKKKNVLEPVPERTEVPSGFLFDRIPSPMISIVFLMGFLCSLDTTVIFPSLYSYISHLNGSILYYGFVAAGYSLGQVIGAPILGWWTDKRNMKEVLLVCSFFACLGNVIYFYVLGRFIAGIGGGSIMVSYGHIARVTTNKSERESRLVMYSWMVRLGQVLAPAIGAIGAVEDSTSGSISMFTLPPFIMLLFFGIFFIGQLIYAFYTRDEISSQMYHLYQDPMEDSGILGEAFNIFKPDSLLLLGIFFAHIVSYWAFIAAVVPFIQLEYHYSLTYTYLFFLFIGVIFALSFGLFKLFQWYNTLYKMLMTSLLISALGMVLAFQFTEHTISLIQLSISTGLIVSGYCIGTVILPVLYSSLIGVKLESLGVQQSSWFALVSLSMAIGPMWGSYMSHLTPDNMQNSALSGLVLLILALILLILKPVSAVQRDSLKALDSIEIPMQENMRSSDSLHESLLVTGYRY